MAKVSQTSKQKTQAVQSNTPKFDFAFGKINYILLIAGIVVLALGFILLMGGGSKDPAVFNEKIFDTQRMVIAPITLIVGFVIEIFAIMVKAKN